MILIISDYFKKFESFERKKIIIGCTNNMNYSKNNLDFLINFKTEKGIDDLLKYLSNVVP
jgi:hypothetical protein